MTKSARRKNATSSAACSLRNHELGNHAIGRVNIRQQHSKRQHHLHEADDPGPHRRHAEVNMHSIFNCLQQRPGRKQLECP
jgi:hypothetical protein